MQEVIRKFDICFVDLINQKDRANIGFKGLPDFAFVDVVFDVMDAVIAELRVPQPRNSVIFIEALLCFGGGFDIPFNQRRAEAF